MRLTLVKATSTGACGTNLLNDKYLSNVACATAIGECLFFRHHKTPWLCVAGRRCHPGCLEALPEFFRFNPRFDVTSVTLASLCGKGCEIHPVFVTGFIYDKKGELNDTALPFSNSFRTTISTRGFCCL